jgi:uncharacterized membrane protein YdbT with pleckstrin-like domain
MKYEKIWQKVLAPGEKVLYEFTVSERYRKLGIITSIITTPLIIGFLGLIFYLWYVKKANAYAFTNKRILIHKGVFSTHLISVDYDKITDVIVKEPFFDRLIMKTGSLIINTAGTTLHEVVLSNIDQPYEIKKKLDEIRG